MEEIVFEVQESARADMAVSLGAEVSRAMAVKLIEDGKAVRKNGSLLKKSEKLQAGEEICVILPDPEPLEIVAQEMPLDIRYEDEDVIVINKEKGVVVHPAPGHPDGTLVNALLYHCGKSLSGIGGVARPGIVHRIDRDTSGLLIVAKNDEAHQKLSEDLKEHLVAREYIAVIEGHLPETNMTVNRPIGRDEKDRKKMAVVSKGGKEAVTHLQVLEEYPGYSLVLCTLETGRTHQIRVHLASLGHPIVGDSVYGRPKNEFHLNGQCLHARTLTFRHPKTGEKMEIHAPTPPYFQKVVDCLRARLEV